MLANIEYCLLGGGPLCGAVRKLPRETFPMLYETIGDGRTAIYASDVQDDLFFFEGIRDPLTGLVDSAFDMRRRGCLFPLRVLSEGSHA